MNKEVEYLKEHLYEIYKYKKGMKDLTYDMDIEHLLRTCKALDYSQKEIERLHSIIKEVREYIWSTKYEYGDLEEDNEDFNIDTYKLLEILDKENKECLNYGEEKEQ